MKRNLLWLFLAASPLSAHTRCELDAFDWLKEIDPEGNAANYEDKDTYKKFELLGQLIEESLYAYASDNPDSSSIWDLCHMFIEKIVNDICLKLSNNAALFTVPENIFESSRELSRTTTHVIGNGEGSPNLHVHTNGVKTSEKDFKERITYLSNLTKGMPMIAVHHRTCFVDGSLDDYLRYFYYLTTGCMSNASKEYLSVWSNHYKNYPGGRILVTCHSEGAVHVRNALTHCPPEIRQQIDVVVIAGGAYIDKNLAGSVVHYCSMSDFVPYIDYFGRLEALNQGTVKMLKPAPGAQKLDHAFASPTYQKHIRTHLEKLHDSTRKP